MQPPSTGFAMVFPTGRVSRPASLPAGPARFVLSFGGSMRISTAALSILALTSMGHTALSAQEARSKSSEVAAVRDERFKWSFGVEGGALFFTTQKQTLSGMPA